MKYVIYDQFHWNQADHLVRHLDCPWDEALEQYRFYKSAFPDLSLGLVPDKVFQRLVKTFKRVP